MTYDPNNRSDRIALAKALREALTKAQFKVVTMPRTKEEVWAYATSNPKVRVLVYSTIVNGEVRSNGKDAIRVALVYKNADGSERGMVKDTRVNRTGEIDGIVDRMLGRVRRVFDAGKQVPKCPDCSAPTFTSKKGNIVCMEFCYKQARADAQARQVANGRDEPSIRDYPHIPF